MIVNLNWFVAVLGCAVMFLFWWWQRSSGMRGLMFVLIGASVIIGTAVYEQNPAQLPGVVGFLLAFLIFALLLFCLVRLSLARRHQAPRYQAPDEMRGRCSECARVALLKHYEQGWLCTSCAHRRHAQAA